jgi:hypothetical protein
LFEKIISRFPGELHPNRQTAFYTFFISSMALPMDMTSLQAGIEKGRLLTLVSGR